jgi:hypothetical protein
MILRTTPPRYAARWQTGRFASATLLSGLPGFGPASFRAGER